MEEPDENMADGRDCRAGAIIMTRYFASGETVPLLPFKPISPKNRSISTYSDNDSFFKLEYYPV